MKKRKKPNPDVRLLKDISRRARIITKDLYKLINLMEGKDPSVTYLGYVVKYCETVINVHETFRHIHTTANDAAWDLVATGDIDFVKSLKQEIKSLVKKRFPDQEELSKFSNECPPDVYHKIQELYYDIIGLL